MLELLIIDSTIITNSKPIHLQELEQLCSRLQHSGVKIALVATNKMGMRSAILRNPHISFALSLSGEEVLGSVNNSYKGGPRRITDICQQLGVSPSKTLYIGDDHADYTSALHAGSIFIMAAWVKHNITFKGITADSPFAVWRYASHYLLNPIRWSFTLDDPARGFHLRGLLSANTKFNSIVLSGNAPFQNFNLIELLKDQRDIKCGRYDADQILFWHAMSSLVMEGLCPPYSTFTVYPSSTPGQMNPVVARLADSTSRVLGAHFHDDILVRGRQVPKSRLEKIARRDSFLLQTNSVYLNPEKKSVVKDKVVVVFDDFHTTGKSLDWARILLSNVGAKSIVLVSLGKFGSQYSYHETYDYIGTEPLNPHILHQYLDSDFTENRQPLTPHNTGATIITASFKMLKDDKAFDGASKL